MRTVLTIFFLAAVAGVAGLVGWQMKPQDPAGGTLAVTATPVGADVFIDGTFRGYAPATLTDLAPGQHVVRLSAVGYTTSRQKFTLEMSAKNARQQSLTLTLVPEANAGLRVSSSPNGALVVLNGNAQGHTPLTLNNLPPGQCSLEIVKTNYNRAMFTPILTAGKVETIKTRLVHRQVEAIRGLIRTQPETILNYNDLGELLYVLGRDKEAAAVYVDGLVACANLKDKSEPNRRNMGKLLREYRRKHSRPAFRTVLDAEIMGRVNDGETSTHVFKAFKELAARKPDAYLTTLEHLVKRHQQDNRFLLELLRLHCKAERAEKASEFVTMLIGRKPPNFGDYLYAARIVLNLYARLGTKDRAAFYPAVEKMFVATRPLKRYQTHDAEFAYEESRFAGLRKRIVKQIEFLSQAVARQTRTNIRNTWRLELARIHFDRKAYEKARDLCVAIRKTNDKRNSAYKQAARLRRRAQAQLDRIAKEQKEKASAEAKRKAALAMKKATAERERKAREIAKRVAAENAKRKAAAKDSKRPKIEDSNKNKKPSAIPTPPIVK